MRRFGELEAVIMERLWGWGRPVLVREVVDALHEDRAHQHPWRAIRPEAPA